MALPKNAQEIVDFASLGHIEEGVLKMPTLWSKRATDKFGYWQISIGCVNRELEPSEMALKDTNGEWIQLIDEWEAITDDLIQRGDVTDGYVGVYWTSSGQEGGKETISKPTFVAVGKNEGKANYTTPFTQALRDAMTQYNAKVRKGHITEDAKKFVKKEGDVYTFNELLHAKHRGEFPWRVNVMTLHDVNKSHNWDKVKYPCYVQPKINGTHFVIVSHPELPAHKLTLNSVDKTKKPKVVTTHMDWYSRGLENFAPQDHIFAELYECLEARPGLHVTGELWIKGAHLQDLSGAARREKDPKTKSSNRQEAPKQEFHIFDCFYVDQPNMPFEDRLAILEEIFEELEAADEPPKWCKMVQTYLADNREQLDSLYRGFLDEKYEGAVIRNKDSPYEVGVDKPKRSYQTMKMKPREDSEFEIIDFTEGEKGKGKGAIKWICKTDKGNEFKVSPNWKYDVQYAAFKALNTVKGKKFFSDKIKGKMATIEYAELSKDETPQQGKFSQFRDSAVETEFAKFIGVELGADEEPAE
jgi:hypothetical protein